MNYTTAKGFLSMPERELLFDLAKKVEKNGLILNIGVEYGASMVCLLVGADPTVTVYGLDLNIDKAMITQVANCKLVACDSHEYLKNWHNAISLLFIDGDHTAKGVLSDAEYGKFVAEHGLMLFHDCYAWEDPKHVNFVVPEVNAAVTEWYNQGNRAIWEELPSVSSIRQFRKK